MTEEFAYATDGDPDLKYIRKLGAGGYGSVHEVLYWYIINAYLDL
jgi:hypothetical protein